MRLKKWIYQHEYTYESFSKEFDLNIRSVEKWCRGERYPSFPAIKKIQLATNGQVKCEDHYNACIAYQNKRDVSTVSK